ncbi:hypothetical protein LY90DRAFT_677208 [Neocallimastix californiae]|uniref:Protein MON2 homolog n=1 Tax=Neocallimastix californiae TaxID=1754190 RepID=A0A1Y2A6Z4_9FUNG|nr:hypothetical protein LY90DRAFT_677208 [Neocallimastix californiae]|eukprot:ORY18273.1 hypothetical protein LY90DRAFT_677208 [Neocallimastix californiae]
MSTNLNTFFRNELLSLSNETKRKYPKIKEVSEKCILKLRTIGDNGKKSNLELASELSKNPDFIEPLQLACETQNNKLSLLSLSCIYQLLNYNAVSELAANSYIKSLLNILNGNTEIQLKILQVLLSFIYKIDSLHGDVIYDSLLICFKLQNLKNSNVNNTAAATLRQLIICLFDKVNMEMEDVEKGNKTFDYHPFDNDGKIINLTDYQKDAYVVFQDLCLLISKKTPLVLKINSLQKAVGLELIDSVISTHYPVFQKNNEFTNLLKVCVCPTIVKLFSDRNEFNQTIRLIRVIELIIKQFTILLKTECEIFLTKFLKILEPDQYVVWQRVLIMEVFMDFVTDKQLIKVIFEQYDMSENFSDVFQNMIYAFSRLIVSEKPSLISSGSSANLFNRNMSPNSSQGSSLVNLPHGNDSSMLTINNSCIRIRCLDQFDKTEPPVIPDTYLIYLALKCITSIINEFSNSIFSLHHDINSQQTLIQKISKKPVEDNIIKNMSEVAWSGFLAALSFLLTANIEDTLFSLVLTSYQQFTVLCGYFNLTVPQDAFMISLCKTSLPDSNISSSSNTGSINTLSFDRSISCIQTFLNISFILSSRFTEANWYLIIDTLQETDNNISTMKHATTVNPQGSTISLTKSFEIIGRRSSTFNVKSNSSSANTSQNLLANSVTINEEQIKEIRKSIDGFFQDSVNMTPFTFKKFYNALVTISGELYGIQCSNNNTNVLRVSGNKDLKKSKNINHSFVLEKLQFVTLLNIDRLIYEEQNGEISENNTKFETETETENENEDAASNNDVIEIKSSNESKRNKSSWNFLNYYLISMAHSKIISVGLREQVCKVIFEILIYIVKHCFIEDNKKDDPKYKKEIEEKVINTFYELIMNSNEVKIGNSIKSDENDEISESDIYKISINAYCSILDAKRAGLEKLNDIIQIGGQYFSYIWKKVFIIIDSVVNLNDDNPTINKEKINVDNSNNNNDKDDDKIKKNSSISTLSSSTISNKQLALIREGFSCLQLICTDFLLLLDPMNIYYCINTIIKYAEFSKDTNISLTAIGLSWSIMDHLQTKKIGFTYQNEAQFIEQNYNNEKTYEILTKENSKLYPNHNNSIYRNWLENGGEWNIDSLNSLYLYLISNLSNLCFDSHSEIRNSANQTLFNTINMNGYYLNLDLWNECLWIVLFPLLQKIQEESEQASKKTVTLEEKLQTSKKWDEIKVLTLNGMTQYFHNFKNILVFLGDSFEKAWLEYLKYLNCWNKASLEISYYVENENENNAPSNTITDESNIKNIVEGYTKIIESNINTISNSINTINILTHQQLDQLDNEKEASERIKNIKENIKNNISIINNAISKIQMHISNYIENGLDPINDDNELFKYLEYINEKLIEVNNSNTDIKLTDETSNLNIIKIIDIERLKTMNKEKNIQKDNSSSSSLNDPTINKKTINKSDSVHYFYHHSNQEVCYTIMQSLNLLLNNDDILSTSNNNKLIRKSSQFFFNKSEKEENKKKENEKEEEEEEEEDNNDDDILVEKDNEHTEIIEDGTNNSSPAKLDNAYDKNLEIINMYIKSLEDKGSKTFIYKKSHLYWSIYTTWEQIGECILDSAYLIQDNFIVSKEESNKVKEEGDSDKMNSCKYRYASRAGPCTSDTLCEYMTVFKNLYIMIRSQFKLENVKQLLTIVTGLVLYNSLPEHPNSPIPHYIGDKEIIILGRERGEGEPLDLSKETIIKKQDLIDEEIESIIIEVINVITVYSQLCFTSRISLPNMNHKESIPYIQRMLIGTKHNKLIDNKIKSSILTKDVLNKLYPIPPQFSMIAFSYKSLLLLSNSFNFIYYYSGIYSKNVYLNIFKAYQCYIDEKYNCPIIQKQDIPIWKIAVSKFKDITKTGLAIVDIINKELAPETINNTYRILTDTINSYLSGVLKLNKNMNLKDIESDEKFNIEFLKFITDDILNYYGSSYVKNEEFKRIINNIGNNSKISYENDEFSRQPNSFRSFNQRTFPYSLDIYKEHEITLLGCENLPSFNEKFEMECLNTLFNLCQKNKDKNENQNTNNNDIEIKKQKIAEITYPVLLLRCKKALMNYSYNINIQNRCPLPGVKQEEIEFILTKMKTISIRPNLLHLNDLENQPFKKELLLGSSSHLYYLYMPLCLSLKTNSEKIKMIIQDCLLRIGKEIGL